MFVSSISEDKPRSGTQTIERAVDILRLVANRPLGGLRLAELVAFSGLTKATAHRIANELVESGLLMRDSDRFYRLGPFAHELGVAASTRFRARDVCQTALADLARYSRQTVYLKVRTGGEVFCLDMVSPPSRAWSHKGSRVALGKGACGLALLSFLPTVERQAWLERMAPDSANADLARRIQITRDNGYAFADSDVVRGVAALSVPILDAVGNSLLAVSVAMPTSAWTQGARLSVRDDLQSCASNMRKSLLDAGLLTQPALIH